MTIYTPFNVSKNIPKINFNLLQNDIKIMIDYRIDV
jgi:hypothetical protein